MTANLARSDNDQDKTLPDSLFLDHLAKADVLRVMAFTQDEVLIEHGVVFRIEFRDKRCNVTLKNTTSKKQSVNIRVWVLNNALIQVWHQSEKWMLTSLQPDQVHLLSWEFKTSVPDVVWNSKARSEDPAWIVIAAE